VGAERYRQLLKSQQVVAETPPDGAVAPDDQTEVMAVDKAEGVRQVTITLVGQVKAGKSSLVNALLGEQRARTNVLPETRDVTRYELRLETIPTRLEILDTVGYGHSGPRQDQVAATQEAAQQSDVLLLVLHARNAARQPDLLALQALREWFDARPDVKMPRGGAGPAHTDPVG